MEQKKREEIIQEILNLFSEVDEQCQQEFMEMIRKKRENGKRKETSNTK